MKARILAPENRKWLTLVAVAFGLFMIMLDNTIVNVALPSIQHDLHIGISELEWVFNGYALTFGVLMLTGGKLADLLGRRLIFIVGLVIFAGSSLACGLATTGGVLIGARVVQGVGAALMNPATLSIITATFPPRQRGTAIGIWAVVSALALAFGPIVGGVLTEDIHWSWIFFINIPVGVAGVLGALVFIDETKDMSREQRLDLPGLLSSGIGLFALTYGLIETNDHSWGSARVLTLFAIAFVALATFVVLELRQRIPMLDLSLFTDRTFSGANTVMFLVGLAMFGIFFYNSLFFQRVLGYGAIKTGASFLPMTMAPTTAAAMASVPVDKAGVGSAVINSMRQVGGSLGIAVMGALVATRVSVKPFDPRYSTEFVGGYHRAVHVGAAICLAGAVVAVSTIRKLRHAEARRAAEPAVGA